MGASIGDVGIEREMEGDIEVGEFDEGVVTGRRRRRGEERRGEERRGNRGGGESKRGFIRERGNERERGRRRNGEAGFLKRRMFSGFRSL